MNAVEAHLTDLLGRVFACDDRAEVGRLNDAIGRFVLAGGKRVRPQLCLWTFRACGEEEVGERGSGREGEKEKSNRNGDSNGSTGEESILTAGGRFRVSDFSPPHPHAPTPPRLPPPLLDVACAWELFHAFLLAHDDIIDEAGTRRARPSLHRELASVATAGGTDDSTMGVNLAIVAGDLMFGAAMRVLHELDLPHGVHLNLLRLFSRVVCTTGFGQAVDICQARVPLADACERTLLREYHWKTAAYTFEGPMLSGAVLAGADAPTQAAISRFALALGQAYQLENDLLDLRTRAHAGCDLIQGKRTVTLLRGRKAMPPEQRERFDARFDSLATANGQAVSIAESLRLELLDAGADLRTGELIESFLSEAAEAANDPALTGKLSGVLRALLASMEKRYFLRSAQPV